MRSFVKDGDNLVFALGNKATLMEGNRNIEQRGPLGKTLPRKTTTTLPVVAQQRCPFRINIYYHKYDGYYYLSINGNVHNFQKGIICSHHHHERQAVVFSSRTDMDEHVEKMVKQFAMTNSSPSTCVRMLHRMGPVTNIFNKAKKSLLEEKRIDTSSAKAQQLVDCQTGIGSCLKYSVVQVIDTLVSVFSKERILVLPVLRGVSDIDGTFL
jgi:hypothetical protein